MGEEGWCRGKDNSHIENTSTEERLIHNGTRPVVSSPFLLSLEDNGVRQNKANHDTKTLGTTNDIHVDRTTPTEVSQQVFDTEHFGITKGNSGTSRDLPSPPLHLKSQRVVGTKLRGWR